MGVMYTFQAKLWLYEGEGAWCFVTLPPRVGAEIKQLASDFKTRGFGAVKVEITCNGQVWQSSIFPDKKSGSYVLPVKKAVRDKVGIAAGDTADFSLTLVDL